MSDTTIINLTDDTPIDQEVLALCRKQLLLAADSLPIVVVSQSEQVPFGRNISLGPIGRSWWSLYTQLLTGVLAAETRYVVVAERDMLYTSEHLHWVPPSDSTLYHNTNMWILQWSPLQSNGFNGMFSYRRGRTSLANLVCSRDLLKRNTEDRMKAIRESRQAYRIATRKSDRAVHLSGLIEDQMPKYQVEEFRTVVPIVDIRHETNFSGVRKGNLRRPDLYPWGTIEDLKRSCSRNWDKQCATT